MERLTDKRFSCDGFYQPKSREEAKEIQRMEKPTYEQIYKRLAHYEDLEEQGRLVILPAKTVYELTWDAGPNCDLVCPVSIDGEGQCDFCDHGELCIYERGCKQEHIPLIGKTVFLTRPEAEAALAASGKEEQSR